MYSRPAMALTCATSVGDGHEHSSCLAAVGDGNCLSLILSMCHHEEVGIFFGHRSGMGTYVPGDG